MRGQIGGTFTQLLLHNGQCFSAEECNVLGGGAQTEKIHLFIAFTANLSKRYCIHRKRCRVSRCLIIMS